MAMYYWAQSQVSQEDWDLLSWQLFEYGAEAVEELDAPEGLVLFRVNMAVENLRDQLVAAFPELNFELGEEENQDWDLHWRLRQKPVQVSDGLQVCPPWVEPEPKENQIVLRIEAKMAFGTGEHESTRLCAQILESQIKASAPARLLDIGAGTGVLAMYALKLGAQSAVMTEIDPVCVPCQVENFELNGLGQPQGILGALEAFVPGHEFDMIVCNMIRSEIWPLRTEMNRLLQNKGRILLSGQLAAEDGYVRDWFNEIGFTIIEEKVDGEWWAVCAQKQ